MQKSAERILTTHAGSLPRPPALVDLFVRRAAREAVDDAALDGAIDAATRRIVPKQLEAGLDVINDGEQPREAFFLYVRHRMTGFSGLGTRRGPADVSRYPFYQQMRQRLLDSTTAVSSYAPPVVTGGIRYADPAFVEDECTQFRRILDELPDTPSDAFVTAPSPGIIAAAVPNQHYATFDAYLNALADALRVEYQAIVRHGFLLQLDCPDLALERHVSFADRPLGDFLSFVEKVVATINRAVEDIPSHRIRMHVCWGNYEGPHDLDVPLSHILPLLGEARVGAFVLPFANPRHAHEYRLLENGALGRGRGLVAGVIDTTTNYVEHPETVADRIERIANSFGDPRSLMAGTDCGFDTSAGMGKVAEDVAWAKLAALAEGARLASERLFR